MGHGWKQDTSHAAVGYECLKLTTAPFPRGLLQQVDMSERDLPSRPQHGHGTVSGVLYRAIHPRPDAQTTHERCGSPKTAAILLRWAKGGRFLEGRRSGGGEPPQSPDQTSSSAARVFKA